MEWKEIKYYHTDADEPVSVIWLKFAVVSNSADPLRTPKGSRPLSYFVEMYSLNFPTEHNRHLSVPISN